MKRCSISVSSIGNRSAVLQTEARHLQILSLDVDNTAATELLGIQTITIQGDPNAEAFYESIGACSAGYRESASIPGRFLPVFKLEIDKGK